MPSKKQLQVAELIKRNFGMVLTQNGINIYGAAFVTVTNVIMSPDLSMAKIYLSIYNVEDKNEVLSLMNREMYTLKSELVYRIKKHVRRIPDISFFVDETVDEMYRVDQLFDRLYAEKKMGEEE